ncbi:hypothetical protein [Mumia sp. Pv 4-285]|uniref:hypothetical protein n=1 Tax=Mumia qirimensis TaxID=3234852 RepID=UPI00351CEEBB
MIRRTADGAVGSDGTGVAVAIEDVAHELYGALPADFVSTRTAAAKEARASGDAPLARRIAALRKPTKAAWATNLLVREERSRVEALLELGTELRDAQERLDAAVLRGAASRRRELVAELVGAARRLAEQAGEPLGDPGADAVATTLNAALADARAAAALETGLLVDSLTATGFEPIDLDGLVALPEAVGEVVGRPHLRLVPSPEPASTRRATEPRTADRPARKARGADRTSSEPTDAPRRRRPDARSTPKAGTARKPKADASTKADEARRKKAEATRKQAEATRKDAEDRLSSAREEAAAAQQRATEASAAVNDLEQRRTALQDELVAVEEALTRGHRTAKEARRATAAAEREEARARRALDDLS